jgi:hypothetical protein
MTDEELIRRFELDAIPEDSFHHADHVRLAFAYLSRYPAAQYPPAQYPPPRYPPLSALERFTAALQRYAAARGKAQRYHETITHAYFFLIRERLARSSADSGHNDWDEFSRRNPDLLIWKNGILTRYYQEATLQSDLARRVFLLPDNLR